MLEWITDPSAWVALATLTALEIVLGIDNIIFNSILSGKLPENQRAKGYIYFAMGFSVFVEMLNLRIRDGLRAP